MDTYPKEPKKNGHLRLAYIIGTYPGLTTTFIDREIRALRKSGVDLKIISIRHPWTKLSPEQTELQEGVQYLIPIAWLTFLWAHLRFMVTRPRAFFGTLFYLVTRPHPGLGARFKTLLHYGEGVYAAHLLRSLRPNHIHAHFIDRAATVALTAGKLLGVPYSLTAHASDIYVSPVLLKEKLGHAKFVATCTNYNKNYLSKFGEGLFNHKLNCIYHGLDVARYHREEKRAADRPVIVSVGQLKERKGFNYLIDACRIMADRGCSFECRIVGEGPLREALKGQVDALGLQDVVHLTGALPHHSVIEQYQEAAIFSLPAILGSDGDRDGIPNVILEAMAMELPVVSTNHSGIPEVVIDNLNGLLVPPADAHALAEALALLLNDRERQTQMGREGRKIVEANFDPEKNAATLLSQFTTTS